MTVAEWLHAFREFKMRSARCCDGPLSVALYKKLFRTIGGKYLQFFLFLQVANSFENFSIVSFVLWEVLRVVTAFLKDVG